MKTWKSIEEQFEKYDNCANYVRNIQNGQNQYDEDSELYQRYEIEKLEAKDELSKIKQDFKTLFKEILEEMAQGKKEFFMGGGDIPRVEGYQMFRQEMLDKIKNFFK